MGCCSNYIPKGIKTPITHNLSLNLNGTICLYAHMQATDAQMTLCKGITFSDYLLHAHTNYNFGGTHRHKCKRLVPLGGCACILRDEFTKIYTRSHKMSFIHVLQHPNAIHVYGYKSIEKPVKAKKNAQFLPYICCLQT